MTTSPSADVPRLRLFQLRRLDEGPPESGGEIMLIGVAWPDGSATVQDCSASESPQQCGDIGDVFARHGGRSVVIEWLDERAWTVQRAYFRVEILREITDTSPSSTGNLAYAAADAAEHIYGRELSAKDDLLTGVADALAELTFPGLASSVGLVERVQALVRKSAAQEEELAKFRRDAATRAARTVQA